MSKTPEKIRVNGRVYVKAAQSKSLTAIEDLLKKDSRYNEVAQELKRLAIQDQRFMGIMKEYADEINKAHPDMVINPALIVDLVAWNLNKALAHGV
jgi:hypothetical protein